MLTSIAILALFGILLLILETFLPGLIAGILGTLSLLAAIWLSLTAEELPYTDDQRIMLVIGIVLFATAVMLVWFRWFAVKFFRHGFTLSAEITSHADPDFKIAPGSQGIALTELRPLGRAEINGQRFEVRCQSGHAPVGSKIEVIAPELGSLIVRTV